MKSFPVRVHEDSTVPWMKIRDVHPAPEHYPDDYLDSYFRAHEHGDDTSLQLYEAKYNPNTFVDVHAHMQDEIIYVVGGSMIVGNKTLRAGSTVFVAASTLYSFKAGEDGLRFLNFRPRADDSHIMKDEFLALKKAGKL